jgi:hypothetical protein
MVMICHGYYMQLHARNDRTCMYKMNTLQKEREDVSKWQVDSSSSELVFEMKRGE